MAILARGMQGNEVVAIQEQLTKLGHYKGRIDGDYGPKTAAAVVEFQQQFFVDGIADEETQKVLGRAVTVWDAHDNLPFPVPIGKAQLESVFGVIEYDEAEAGGVIITNGWEHRNIINANLPVVGDQLIHKRMVDPFTTALSKVKDTGADGLIKQFTVWCPRHKMHDPYSDLSTHSWGIACDINWATNPVGVVGDLHPDIIAAFESTGFVWGGHWRTRDDMHFQFVRQY